MDKKASTTIIRPTIMKPAEKETASAMNPTNAGMPPLPIKEAMGMVIERATFLDAFGPSSERAEKPTGTAIAPKAGCMKMIMVSSELDTRPRHITLTPASNIITNIILLTPTLFGINVATSRAPMGINRDIPKIVFAWTEEKPASDIIKVGMRR